jgi:hypothetical protein
MKGKELWSQYQHHTRDITEHGRKLGFAGAAICWFFRDSSFSFPPAILTALALFVGYFALDLLHGLLGALRVKSFTEEQEGRMWAETRSLDGEIEVPRSLDRPAFALFLSKLAFLLAGFAAVTVEIALRIRSLN